MKYLLKPYLIVREPQTGGTQVVNKYPVVSGMPVVEVEGTEEDVARAALQLEKMYLADDIFGNSRSIFTWVQEIIEASVD